VCLWTGLLEGGSKDKRGHCCLEGEAVLGGGVCENSLPLKEKSGDSKHCWNLRQLLQKNEKFKEKKSVSRYNQGVGGGKCRMGNDQLGAQKVGKSALGNLQFLGGGDGKF